MPKILIMDDELLVRLMLEKVIEHLGYDVVSVKDGEEAIAAWTVAMNSDSPFSIAIMDLMVPEGMGGQEMVKRLKIIDPKARAIVISGNTQDPLMEHYASYGFDAVITKPFHIGELQTAISMQLAP